MYVHTKLNLITYGHLQLRYTYQTQMIYMPDIYYADLWLKAFKPGQFYLCTVANLNNFNQIVK